MAKLPTIYDLMLVLTTGASEEDRAKIVTDVESTITTAGGIIERNQSWGTRPMTFEINHQGEGEYHLLQFSAPTAVLETLSHNLRIADNVLRFRIIKVLPGTPPAPDSPPPVLAAAAPVGSAGGEDPPPSIER